MNRRNFFQKVTFLGLGALIPVGLFNKQNKPKKTIWHARVPIKIEVKPTEAAIFCLTGPYDNIHQFTIYGKKDECLKEIKLYPEIIEVLGMEESNNLEATTLMELYKDKYYQTGLKRIEHYEKLHNVTKS